MNQAAGQTSSSSAVAGPTVEEHLTDADGDRATVLEVPVRVAAAQPG